MKISPSTSHVHSFHFLFHFHFFYFIPFYLFFCACFYFTLLPVFNFSLGFYSALPAEHGWCYYSKWLWNWDRFQLCSWELKTLLKGLKLTTFWPEAQWLNHQVPTALPHLYVFIIFYLSKSIIFLIFLFFLNFSPPHHNSDSILFFVFPFYLPFFSFYFYYFLLFLFSSLSLILFSFLASPPSFF